MEQSQVGKSARAQNACGSQRSGQYSLLLFKNIYLFWLYWVFLAVWAFSLVAGLLSIFSAWASHCGGFYCCVAWALGFEGFSSCNMWAQELWLEDSRVQAQ